MFTKKQAKWLAKSDLTRKYLMSKLFRDLPRSARHRFEDFDADDMLRYVGLSTYKPGRVFFGGMGAFLIGAAIGGIVAVLLTPKPGSEIRSNVKNKAMGYLGKQGIGISPEKTASA
jgi:hypothetical protein